MARLARSARDGGRTTMMGGGQSEDESEDEAQLEDFLFGEGILGKRPAERELPRRHDLGDDHSLFFIDERGDRGAGDDTREEEAGERAGSTSVATEVAVSRPKWTDPDDETISLALSSARLKKLRRHDGEVVRGDVLTSRLREQFERTSALPLWAKRALARGGLAGDDEDGDGDVLFTRERTLLNASGAISATKDGRLPKGKLSIERFRNANQAAPSHSVLSDLDFHPTRNSLLLTAGLDKTLRFFTADGKSNPNLISVFFPDLPIHSAKFHPSGSAVLVTGRRPFFHIYDVQKGTSTRIGRGLLGREEQMNVGPKGFAKVTKKQGTKSSFAASGSGQSLESFQFNATGTLAAFPHLGHRNGVITIAAFHASGLMAGQSGQTVAHIKVGSPVRAVSWRGDHELVTVSRDDDIRVFDLRSLQVASETVNPATPCVQRWHDVGGFALTSLAIADYEIAVGSKMGLVNIYQSTASTGSAPPLLKTLDNLTTSITSLSYSPSQEILLMASRTKADSLRLVHTGSRTVFANWPTFATPLSMVQCTAFSKRNDLLAMGNEKGKVLLYNLKHYV